MSVLSNDQALYVVGASWENDQELRVHPSAITRSTEDDSGYFERLGAKTESVLESGFTRWGKFCATHPWKIILCGSLFVICMGFGVTQLIVTTDPVELWASSSSRSRTEREYFDKEFEPFYRIEQVTGTY